MDGAILKTYIESKELDKTKLAADFGMSKQNLYQLFRSKAFEQDTIDKIERKFRMKWDKIKEQVNIDVPSATTRTQAAQKKAISTNGHNGVKKDYLSGKNLQDFSAAHRRLAETNSELALVIARVLPGNYQDQVLAPRLVDLITEIFSGKKQISVDELTKELRKALARDNRYT